MANEKETIDEKFRKVHYANPHVYVGLRRLALEARGRGHATYAIEELVAVLRWHTGIKTVGHDGFKLNDHYTSRYSRMLMQLNPELEGFFRTRKINAPPTDYTTWPDAEVQRQAEQIMRTTAAANEARESEPANDQPDRRTDFRGNVEPAA